MFSIFAKNLVFTGQHDEPNYNLFNFPDAAKSKKILRLIYHGKDYPRTVESFKRNKKHCNAVLIEKTVIFTAKYVYFLFVRLFS